MALTLYGIASPSVTLASPQDEVATQNARLDANSNGAVLQNLLDLCRRPSKGGQNDRLYFDDLICTYLRLDETYRAIYTEIWTYEDWVAEQGADWRHIGAEFVAKTRAKGDFHGIRSEFHLKKHRIRKSEFADNHGGIGSYLGEAFPDFNPPLECIKEATKMDADSDANADDYNLGVVSKWKFFKRNILVTEHGRPYCPHDYPSKSTSREDVLYFVYGLLHSAMYRERCSNNFGKRLPRLPLVKSSNDFWAFSAAGRELADAHLKIK